MLLVPGITDICVLMVRRWWSHAEIIGMRYAYKEFWRMTQQEPMKLLELLAIMLRQAAEAIDGKVVLE